MVSREKKLRLLKGASGRRGAPRAARRNEGGTVSPNAQPGDQKRLPTSGERLPTDEDPRFALRCVCGGVAGGVFPVLAVDGQGVVRQRKLSGVRCSGCRRTYSVEWPEEPGA